ncbi:hypothetical protein CHARACLAT_030017 [Characodon lateralis]|uniref:Uncharacterized protein n=1 Tax=Characodon lateralis TaxID=208331 RepID=A0ABU7EGX0_9TELE|nr:hypothetical protein [Characodon lateralis]
MEVCVESPQADDNQYTGMTREQPQTPIYENFQNQKASFKREPAQSEEDLYIQCDSVDEGIYSNDPEFNSKRPDPQEEDVYLMPES